MNDTQENKRLQQQRALVAEAWLALAAMAYAQYVHGGRGALVIDGNLDGAPKWLPLSGVPSDVGLIDLEDAIRTYDPEREIVVMFDYGQTKAHGRYSAEGENPPPVAYENSPYSQN